MQAGSVTSKGEQTCQQKGKQNLDLQLKDIGERET